jgi:hypothetical protein
VVSWRRGQIFRTCDDVTVSRKRGKIFRVCLRRFLHLDERTSDDDVVAVTVFLRVFVGFKLYLTSTGVPLTTVSSLWQLLLFRSFASLLFVTVTL